MKKLLRLSASLGFMFLCLFIYEILDHYVGFGYWPDYAKAAAVIGSGVLGWFTLARAAAGLADKGFNKAEKWPAMTMGEALGAVAGFFIGLSAGIIAIIFFLSVFSYFFWYTGLSLWLLAGFALTLSAALGWRLGKSAGGKVKQASGRSAPVVGPVGVSKPKILDTSVIIDGRIVSILRTGFLEGKIIVPSFIIEELRRIADSSDTQKRNKGRMGLDALSEIKGIEGVSVEIVEWAPPKETGFIEVDMMLLKMAQDIDGFVVTNDVNLIKVAGLHKITMLNINDLSNAVKSMVIPGQEMRVFVAKEGKEHNQGVAYLNDGTMIVIEEGKKFMDKDIEIIVTSVLQTQAGRMIFGKYKDESY